MHYTYYKCAAGSLMLAGEPDILVRVHFEAAGREFQIPADWLRDDSCFTNVIDQLESYFKGERFQFTLKLRLNGTPFQQRVWKALSTLPFGETISYSELAYKIGNPKAVRAVGGAVGRNPIPIVVPCHRVIGKNGSLVGFGGGLNIKKILLDHERELVLRRKTN